MSFNEPITLNFILMLLSQYFHNISQQILGNKLLIVMIPTKIRRLVSIEHWWLQDLILKANNKSEETGGDRPKVLR